MEILTDPLIIVGNLYNTLSETCDQVDKKFSKGIEDFKNKSFSNTYNINTHAHRNSRMSEYIWFI